MLDKRLEIKEFDYNAIQVPSEPIKLKNNSLDARRMIREKLKKVHEDGNL
jgi:hypothetical protein